MWRDPKLVEFKGRMVSLKALSEGFNVPYTSVLTRYRRGYRDPWELLYGEGATPQKLHLTEEQKAWLRETKPYRSGQRHIQGYWGHVDNEWDIACDLIGIPRVFADELKEAIG